MTPPDRAPEPRSRSNRPWWTELPEPRLVTDDEGLDELLEVLEGETEIAVDSEADSFFSYREKVCLVQITAGGVDWLVDPLAGVDLLALADVFGDPDVVKVFHDGEFDVSLFRRDWDISFRGLFDTRVAAACLSAEQPGLASVLKARFEVELDKSMQRSNWAERPLSDKQVAYARLDTHFLLPLMHAQKKELAETGRDMIVETECRRLEGLNPAVTKTHPDDFARIKGARDLTPRERTILRELFVLREKLAEEWDVPPFRVMGNALLLELARIRPSNTKRLYGIKGFTPRMGRRLGDPVLAAIKAAGDKRPIDKLPKKRKRDEASRLDEESAELHERLKLVRKRRSEKLGVESSYLLHRTALVEVALGRPRDLEALGACAKLEQWQLEMFGQPILDAVAGFEQALADGSLPRRRPWRRER